MVPSKPFPTQTNGCAHPPVAPKANKIIPLKTDLSFTAWGLWGKIIPGDCRLLQDECRALGRLGPGLLLARLLAHAQPLPGSSADHNRRVGRSPLEKPNRPCGIGWREQQRRMSGIAPGLQLSLMSSIHSRVMTWEKCRVPRTQISLRLPQDSVAVERNLPRTPACSLSPVDPGRAREGGRRTSTIFPHLWKPSISSRIWR